MRLGGPLLLRAAQAFAIDSDGNLRCFRGRWRRRPHTLRPCPHFGFKRLAVYAPKDGVQGCGTGRVVREAEGVSDIGAVVASPCGDGTVAPGATQHGAARQGEDRGERMAFATRLAKVRD